MSSCGEKQILEYKLCEVCLSLWSGTVKLGSEMKRGSSLQCFIEFIGYYFNSVLTTSSDNLYAERDGISMGSCVAAVLGVFFLL